MRIWIFAMLIFIIGCSNAKIGNVPLAAIDFCRESQKLECLGDCVDGFGEVCYYDSSKHSERDFIGGMSLPKEKRSLCIGIHATAVCGSCRNDFLTYEKGIEEKVSCQYFMSKIIRYNESCLGCVKNVWAGCC